MNEAELKKSLRARIVNAAIEWRALDESEPIPSQAVNEKLKELAFLVDELTSHPSIVSLKPAHQVTAMSELKNGNKPNFGLVGYDSAITELVEELKSAGADMLCIRSYWYDGTIIREWHVSWDIPSNNGAM